MSIFSGMREMALIASVDTISLFVAIGWDLAVGVRKAKERGEARTSYGLSRSATKLLTYYGAFGVGLCIDVLLHVGRLWDIVGFDALMNVPVVATLIAVFLCVVELLSIRESADEKTRKRLNVAGETLVKLASQSDMVRTLAEAIQIAMRNEESSPTAKSEDE